MAEPCGLQCCFIAYNAAEPNETERRVTSLYKFSDLDLQIFRRIYADLTWQGRAARGMYRGLKHRVVVTGL